MANFHAKGFAVVPYQLMDSAPINLRAYLFAVYLVLHRRSSHQGQPILAVVSVHTIQEEAGIGRKSVHAALRWLTEEGWVSRIDRPGNTTAFVIHQSKAKP